MYYRLVCPSIPWSRVLEKLTGSRSKIFPAFYGTRRFITAFTSSRHLSLSWHRSVHVSTSWRSILILLSHLLLGLASGLFPLRFFYRNPVYTSPLPPTCYVPRPSHFNLIAQIFGEEGRSLSSLLCSFLHSPFTSSVLAPNILLSILFSTFYVPPSMWATKFHTHTKQQAKLLFCVS